MIKSKFTNVKKDLNTPFMCETINYYTIQSFFNSDKKTEPIIKELSKKINISLQMHLISRDLSKILCIEESALIKSHKHVITAFELLHPEDIIIKKGMTEYPKLLAITNEAPPYLFMRGNISLVKENIVSVIGSRKASKEGLSKAYRLSKYLGSYGIVVASGLAQGIDTAAHTASIENNFSTISVIGTPITMVYPKENESIQKKISEVGLVISQFPPSSLVQRWNFPMRNAVMSGISLATIIVEAGETSGALKQADYALKQKRIVFIPQSTIDNDNISWPKKYIQRKGVVKFSKIEELLHTLESTHTIETAQITSSVNQLKLSSKWTDISIHRRKLK
jgi:DNA processing protein